MEFLYYDFSGTKNLSTCTVPIHPLVLYSQAIDKPNKDQEKLCYVVAQNFTYQIHS